MAEGSTPGAQPEVQQKPDLSSVLSQARESGKTQRESVGQGMTELKSSLKERAGNAKEKAAQTLHSIKETGSQLKTKTVEFSDIVMGFATSSEARSALTGFMSEKVTDAREKFRAQNKAVKERFLDDRDFLFSKFKEGGRSLLTRANEKLVQPQIARAAEIGGKLKSGGERVRNFFQTQAENTRNGIRARRADVTARWNELLAKPGEIKAGLFRGLGERLLGSASTSSERAQQHRVHATELRTSASAIRGSSATAAGTA